MAEGREPKDVPCVDAFLTLEPAGHKIGGKKKQLHPVEVLTSLLPCKDEVVSGARSAVVLRAS